MNTLQAALMMAASALTLAGVAQAEEAAPVLEQVTVTATRNAKPVGEVPASVSVIDARTIEDRLIDDVKDLLKYEPGVSVRSAPARFTAAGSSLGRDGNAGFNIRGLEGNRVLVQVDGIRVADAYAFGAQSVGRGDYVDLDVLKSVEIVRGPASALYGSDGLAGSVSFITKDPEDIASDRPIAFRGRVAYASADQSWSESLVTATKGETFSAMLAYTRRDGEGQETAGTNDSANANRTTANPEDNQSNAWLAKLVWAPAQGHRFRITWDHLDRDVYWDVLSAIALPPLAATSTLGLTAFDEAKRDRVSVDHRYEGQGLIASAQTSLYIQDSNTRQYSFEDRNTSPDRIRDATFNNRVVGGGVVLQSQLGSNHRLVYGVDYSTTRQEGIRDGAVPPAGETFPTRAFPSTDYDLAGAFIQDEITLFGGKLLAYPALRWDRYSIDPRNDPLFTAAVPASQSDSHISPKLGLVFNATGQVSVFVNAASGFKAPAPSQVNNGFTNPVSNYRSVSNPDLKPETSQTIEGGARFRNDRMSLELVAFSGEYEDFIEQVQVSGAFTPTNPAVYQYVNLQDVKITGVEAKARVALGGGFLLNVAASTAKGDGTRAGVRSPLVSVDPAKLVVGLAWDDAANRFGGELVAVHSAQKDLDRAGAGCTAATCFTPQAFTVFDLTAFWRTSETTTLRVGVFNLTDEKYWWWSEARGLAPTLTTLDAYTQPGRNVSISLAVRF